VPTPLSPLSVLSPLPLVVLLTLTQPVHAQTGLLVVAHGADSTWNAAVRQTVAQVHWQGPVAVAFLMGPEAETAGWQSGVQELVAARATRVVVVPLLVSSSGAHYRQIQYYAGVLTQMPAGLASHDHGAMSGPPPVPMTVTAALDTASELGQVLADRWRALDQGDRGRAVILIAHGPESDSEATRWTDALGRVGPVLAAAGLSRDYRVGLLRDDAPAPVRAAAIQAMRDTIAALAQRTGDSVVALPVMIASSPITTTRIPADIAGLPVRYVATPLAPHAALARWVERVALAEMRGHAASCVTAVAGTSCE
jgi:sirohydrochlorin ferrochelatase